MESKELQEKLYKNSLIIDRLTKLDKTERQHVILELLKDKSERELSEEIGLPRSTINDWRSLRQSNVGKDVHVSFSAFYRKISSMEPSEVTDWGRLEQIRERLDYLFKGKK